MAITNLREVSNNETLYLDLQDIAHSSAIQFVLEITKSSNTEKIETAIQTAAIKTGIHVRYHHGRWVVNDALIKIKYRSLHDEDLTSDSVFNEKIDYRKESIQTYVLTTSNKTYLILRILHSVCDGKGALIFTRNIFRSLNNTELIVCSNTVTDEVFVKRLGKATRNQNNLLSTYKALAAQSVATYTTRWRIIKLQGMHRGIIARLAKSISVEFEGNEARFMVPTDIRRHDMSANYSGNLTLPIFLHTHNDKHWKDINGDLLFQLRNSAELNHKNVDYFYYRHLPYFLRISLLRQIAKRDRFTVSAIISYLGKIDLAEFQSSNVQVKDFMSLPIQQPFTGFSVVVTEHSNQTTIALSYCLDQFSEAHIDELVNRITGDFTHSIYDFNDTYVKYDLDLCTQIQKVLHSSADKVAVICGASKYTYRELALRVNSYAKELEHNNIRPNDKLVICMHRSFEYIALVIACILEGVVFIPTDIKTPAKRLKEIVLDSGVKCIATDERSIVDQFENSIYVTDIEISDDYQIKKYGHNVDRVLYTIYTSGSTGTPKGVEITEKNFSNYLSWARKTYRTREPLSMPLFTSLSVDLTLTSTILPLLCGGKIFVYRDSFSPTVLSEIVSNGSINTVKLTPTHLSLLTAKTKKYNVVGKEIFIVGGEQFRKDVADTLREICTISPRICNEYGPAETTVGSTYYLYNGQDLHSSVIPIGVPIDNTVVLLYGNGSIVNKENKVGEILIGGNGVFKGYIGSIDDKKEVIDGIEYYRTGDLGYIREGVLHCLGRIDSQVKINGNRVEPEEITHILNEFDAIDDSCVLTKNGSLYAFMILNRKICESEILDILKKNLPHYMVPRRLLEIECFPVLESGKIDYNQLASLIQDTGFAHSEHSRVTRVLSSFTEVNDVQDGMTVSSFGLDSLSTLHFLQKIAEQCIDSTGHDAFITAALPRMGSITILDLEKLIIHHNGVV